MLSLAATHLSFLRPETTRYSTAGLHLLTQSARLFRQNLSKAITPRNCDALIGTSLLLQYLAWSNLDFLKADDSSPALNLSHDGLLLLSPGVQTPFLEAMSVLLGEKSVFVSGVVYRPRLRMEEAVHRMGSCSEDLVARFMSLWDDARYVGGPTLAMTVPTEHRVPTARIDPTRPLTTPKEAFEYVVRGVALVLCVASHDASVLERIDIERYFFSFPFLASGPFLDLARGGDARALVVLLHFYRAARVLLTSDGTWWARERSRVLEKLILRELDRRGLGICLG